MGTGESRRHTQTNRSTEEDLVKQRDEEQRGAAGIRWLEDFGEELLHGEQGRVNNGESNDRALEGGGVRHQTREEGEGQRWVVVRVGRKGGGGAIGNSPMTPPIFKKEWCVCDRWGGAKTKMRAWDPWGKDSVARRNSCTETELSPVPVLAARLPATGRRLA